MSTQHELEKQYEEMQIRLKRAEGSLANAQAALELERAFYDDAKRRLQTKLLQLQVLAQGDV